MHLNGLDENGLSLAAAVPRVNEFEYPAGRRADEDDVEGVSVDGRHAGVHADHGQPLRHARLDEERPLLWGH